MKDGADVGGRTDAQLIIADAEFNAKKTAYVVMPVFRGLPMFCERTEAS
jgi:hypothetical protein